MMLHIFARHIRARWLNHVAMRHLRTMDDRQLADMGASRECLADFIRDNAKA